MLGEQGKLPIDFLRARTTRTKTSVMAIIVGEPMKSVNPYLNPHISAESWRMKTTKRPFSIVAYVDPFSGLKNIFALVFTSNCYDDGIISPPQQASSWSWSLIWNIFETGKLHLKELVMIIHHLVAFIQHDPGELRGL